MVKIWDISLGFETPQMPATTRPWRAVATKVAWCTETIAENAASPFPGIELLYGSTAEKKIQSFPIGLRPFRAIDSMLLLKVPWNMTWSTIDCNLISCTCARTTHGVYRRESLPSWHIWIVRRWARMAWNITGLAPLESPRCHRGVRPAWSPGFVRITMDHPFISAMKTGVRPFGKGTKPSL